MKPESDFQRRKMDQNRKIAICNASTECHYPQSSIRIEWSLATVSIG